MKPGYHCTTLLTSILVIISLYSAAQTIDPSYRNYNFVAGEKTLFEDLVTHESGEKIKSMWDFLDGGGAASIAKRDDGNALSFDAFYTRLRPKLFMGKSLPDSFSVEYDMWLDAAYDATAGLSLVMYTTDQREIHIDPSMERVTVFLADNSNISKENPEPYLDDRFFNRWVHFSISVHKKKLQIYLDQYHLLTVDDIIETPVHLAMWGDRQSEKPPILLKNFRIATGFPTQLFENGVFVSRNIKFDVNKSVLKPESITVIRQVKNYLDQFPQIRIEIAGHTDSDGTDAANLLLSQNRAKSVKAELVAMGIAENRITTSGHGATQPVDKANTPAAKAKNRRVEFIIQK